MRGCLYSLLCVCAAIAHGHSHGLSISTALQLGPDLAASRAGEAIVGLLREVDGHVVRNATDAECKAASLCISLGQTALSRSLIRPANLSALGSEGFIVAADAAGDRLLVAANGNPRTTTKRGNRDVNAGALYGAYAALELLGFGFLHPLYPTIPTAFASANEVLAATPMAESPIWPFRSWHYHTEHPLELTEVLLGFNASSSSSKDKYFESWESMLPQLDLFFQWLVANRQNRLEWVLLYSSAWGSYGNSTERQSRLAHVVRMAHDWGILAGVDAPIASRQQHAWYMTDGSGDLKQQQAQIAAHLDWFAAAGYDFLMTENGFSEFTHPDDQKMLSWINFTSSYAKGTHGMQSYIKVHCSTGQVCEHYVDPRTGQPLNFNFLPLYANTEMGVMPHTVELYAYDDPAPTYGNQNFSYIFDFMYYVGERNKARAAGDRREVVFHGETGYWVNYDIDVPLFLGLVYGERRLHDLRYMHKTELARNIQLDGQNNFDSGWEWGYWMGSCLTARAAWNPLSESVPKDDPAAALHEALLPIVRPLFGKSAAAAAAGTLVEVWGLQYPWLVFGEERRPSSDPLPDVAMRNGIAYLAGQDTYSTLEQLFTSSATQPTIVYFTMLSNETGESGEPSYPTLRPLLVQMENTTAIALEKVASWVGKTVSPSARHLWDDIVDAANMTYLRAKQVRGVYDAAYKHFPQSQREAALRDARDAIAAGANVIQRRESSPSFAVPVERVAGWRENPTVYPFTFLWTAHTQYYMWRDYLVAEYLVHPPTTPDLKIISPCYLNVIDPIETAIGIPWLQDLADKIRAMVDAGSDESLKAIVDCIAAPAQEPQLPPDNAKERV